MSLLLALDASTSSIMVGLYRADSGQELETLVAPGARGDTLPEMFRQILSNSGASAHDVSRLACGVGPGSFTGIRAALAAAQGLAFRRQLPVAGVSTLLAALSHPTLEAQTGRTRIALLDAYREEAFARALAPGQSAVSGAGSDVRIGRDAVAGLSPEAIVLWHGRDAQGIPDFALGLMDFLLPSGIARLSLAGSCGEPVPNYLREAAPVEALLAQGRTLPPLS